MKNNGAAYRLSYYGMMLGAAMICGYIETLVPINIGLPGIKLGLANIVAMYIVEKGKPLPALLINTGRIILCGILFSGVFSMFYSLCGGTLAVVMMIAASKCVVFSSIGVGISGAVAHNIGQILAASLVAGPAVFALLPPLMTVGVLTGTLTGLLVAILKKRRIGGM